MKNKITKLAIFDFDGTLVDTPLPLIGKPIYEQKTGQKWPHRGWWGQALSLDTTIFEMPVIEDVVNAYNKEKEQPSTVLVVMTGRLEALRTEVTDILDSHGLKFHEYHLNTGGRTEFVKMRTMEKLLKKYPDVTHIEAWDDRLEHIPIFEAFGQKLVDDKALTSFVVNVVPADRH